MTQIRVSGTRSAGGPTPRPVSSKPAPRGTLARQAANLKTEAVASMADPAVVRDRLALTEKHLEVLDQISRGLPVRDAVAVLAAARLRLDFSCAKPQQSVAVDQRVLYTFIDPYAEPGAAAVEVQAAPPKLLQATGETANDFADRVARQREAELHGKA